ncbi:MAG: transposase [Pyrinomonadaceae bacterium]
MFYVHLKVYHREREIRHRRLTDRARQAILRIWKWFPEKELIFVGDSGYAAIDLLNAARDKVVLVTRLRLDAALYEPAPKLAKRAIRRPRKKGKRLPNLTEVIKNPNTKWQKLVVNWYGVEKEILLTSGTCVWFHVGKQAVPIRWMIVKDPSGKFETQALLGTKLKAEPLQIVEWFIRG